jgi:tRNA(Ile)-lysidine synthase
MSAGAGGRGDPVAAVRLAVRRLLDDAGVAGGPLAVAVSGGADSLALAAATAQLAARRELRLTGLVVDHGLQPDSAAIAERAAKQVQGLGFDEVRVLTVDVSGPGGAEAAARRARYRALREAAPDGLVLLGHTRDDQAETVLLGLGRGSGPRSIAGMRPLDPPWGRPFLDVSRDTTRAVCAALDLDPWQDPHNAEARFTRVRLRHEVLPLLEDVLQGGVAGALARTATQLREDLDTLDTLATAALTRAQRTEGGLHNVQRTEGGLHNVERTEGGLQCIELDAAELAREPAAVRRRVLRRWLLDAGVPELSDGHLRSVDELVGAWRGQGGAWLPGNFEVSRGHGRLRVIRVGRERSLRANH